nr:extracellular solute-binding protein [Martelella sp. HB161492]
MAIKLTRRSFIAATGASSLALAVPALAQSRELIIISNRSNPKQREALETIAANFGRAAGVKVAVNNMDHEAHKTAIRNYLVASPPDICFWYSGERMRSFVEKGLFADITDLVEQEGWAKVVPSMSAVTVKGRQYGLPTAGILWGLFYRQDMFDEAGLTPPKTFDDFFTLGEKAKAAGIVPVSMGIKNMWPAGGWFDHMNLRINGLEFHQALMNGEVAYTDQKVANVMSKWSDLIDAGLFTPNATSYAWEQAASAMVQKRAAMLDLGSFVKQVTPAEDIDQIRFQLFPTIDPSIGRYEDFSVDSIHIPSGAPNPEVAREFLTYFYQPDNLATYIKPDGNPPARIDVDLNDDPIIAMAINEMKTVEGTSQYYDRDTNPDVAQAGMKGFQEFMVYPDRADSILGQIEKARERAYGAL